MEAIFCRWASHVHWLLKGIIGGSTSLLIGDCNIVAQNPIPQKNNSAVELLETMVYSFHYWI